MHLKLENEFPPGPETGPEGERVARVSDLAREFYVSRRMLCAEAVVAALNQELGGGLSEDQALSLGAPFCVAMGDSGCVCGALSGAVLASGLFLGEDDPRSKRRRMRAGARRLHDEFKAAHGATCCRVLSRKVKGDSRAHFAQCAEFTAQAAASAARLILEKRPELARSAGAPGPGRSPGPWSRLTSRIKDLFTS